MLKFELCFEINTTEVLIPDLLNVQEPKFSFEYANALAFVVDYDFLPKSIIPRFIVRMHKDIKKRLRWRTGVVLEDQAFRCSAVIRADENEKRIYIWVEGQLRRDYFAVIRHTLHQINSSFEKLSAIEKVPMPSEPEVCVSYDHLTLLEQRGLDAYIPDGSTHSYSVKKLLGSIYSINRGEEEMLTILRKLQNASDDEESLLTKANQIVQLQPNFFGLGVNLNALIKKLFK